MRKIKKETIVIEFFSFITQQMMINNISDPSDVKVTLSSFQEYINKKNGIELQSRQHIYQQLRTYAREHSIGLLYEKISQDDFYLSVFPVKNYREKYFLHMGLKLALAHGAYDLIMHLCKEKINIGTALSVYLSAGTLSPYLANIFFERKDNAFDIFTCNLGVVESYLKHYETLQHISLYTRFGKIHADTLALLEENIDKYANTTFDAIVGGSGFIDKTGIYTWSMEENKYKKNIFSIIQGIKILPLTTFEFGDIHATPKSRHCQYKYAHLDDFDYIIIPSVTDTEFVQEKLKKFSFNECVINYYTYKVFRNTNSKKSLSMIETWNQLE